MKQFDVQGIDIDVHRETVFAFVADPGNLPQWTNAFASVDGSEALMRTPAGEVPVKLVVTSLSEAGTVDWQMTFPDGSIGMAHSRIVELTPRKSVMSFVLTPPPVPLEQLEGALEEQSRTLSEELSTLKRILERAT